MAERTSRTNNQFDYANRQNSHGRVRTWWKILDQGCDSRRRCQQRKIQGADWHHAAPPHVWSEGGYFWILSVLMQSLGLHWPRAPSQREAYASSWRSNLCWIRIQHKCVVHFMFRKERRSWPRSCKNQVKFSEHEFLFRNRKMVEKHLIDNSTDLLIQSPSYVKWVLYFKFHVGTMIRFIMTTSAMLWFCW